METSTRPPSVQSLDALFAPHQFRPNEVLTLYHVYDNLSQTPLTLEGIECGDPNSYLINPWHIVTVKNILQHLDWKNREPTQFISFYDDEHKALAEARRRRRETWVHGKYRNPAMVKISVVELTEDSRVWVFSKEELMRMLDSNSEVFRRADRTEWLVWEFVPMEHVVRLLEFDVRGNEICLQLK